MQVYLHIFSAGSPAGGNPCGQQEKYVCLYVQKKKTKCICLHTQKKEQNAYVYVCKI